MSPARVHLCSCLFSCRSVPAPRSVQSSARTREFSSRDQDPERRDSEKLQIFTKITHLLHDSKKISVKNLDYFFSQSLRYGIGSVSASDRRCT